MTEKHTIRNSVIAGVIVLVIGYAGTKSLGLFPSGWLSKSATWIGGSLAQQVSLPLWLLLTAGALTLPTLFRIVGAVMRQEPWKEYKQDEFHGMTWRWVYNGNLPDRLIPYCPTDETIVPFLVGRRSVKFRCETCGDYFGEIGGNHRDVVGQIGRQIERKVRTGEWEQVVKRNRAAERTT